MKVQIHYDFANGGLDTQRHKDRYALNADEARALTKFILRVTQNKNLSGTNKPSNIDRNNMVIPEAARYLELCAWHYHSGPTKKNDGTALTIGLNLNLNGDITDEAIHYQKRTESEIAIVGFSPIHVPFPKVLDLRNPLIERLASKDDV